ncbi:succinylglutamate desuccinylase/aspartoacylase family protein [Halorarum halophilum]|uniref:Succinylglutamate desuccinylase/aspartoacylase family protein n=1 Tax=Halorarum halophilum TaxID=2743090 RepID=A0A7D5KY39_9EURY|nr:succinylglutamate desuccinylase/aspartoacylase family protein [Halobaculum halophilum]QLG29258.1 succinylglutamate desuccinylase/aspartoacylase family protein [Halobaculum halophilum]
MPSNTGRRPFLAAVGGIALAGAGIAATSERANAAQADEKVTLLEGTEYETTGYVQTADADGPTVLVVGGLHGNEVAGYEAAANVSDMELERGRLVTVPRANATAIESGTRIGADGTDLNRQFPTDEEPSTELARALWGVVEEYEPDVVIDLHESQELYEGDVEDGVGQAIFHSRDVRAEEEAQEAAETLNEDYVDDSTYDFTVAPFSLPPSETPNMFVHKAARDTDATAFLAETVSDGPELSTRIHWHARVVRSLVWEELLTPGEGDPEDPDDGGDAPEEENEIPVARIETDPENAEETVFSKGETVNLDASASEDPDGEIVTYEWDVNGTNEFEEGDETAEVTLSFCGELPVALRVTDDEGATATEELVLSTV